MPHRSKRTGRFTKGGAKRHHTRRRRRRNPPYQFYKTAPNPRRRHRRRRATVTHRRRTYRRRRNPGILRGVGGLIPAPKRILFGAAGAIVSKAVPDLIARTLPQLPTIGPAGLAVRAAAGIGGGMLVGKFLGKQNGEDFALGALIGVAEETFALYVAPHVGMGSYLSSYLSGAYMAPGANLLPDDDDGMEGAFGPDRLSSLARF